MITAVAREYCSIGGAWELADRPNDRYWSNQILFTANSSSAAWDEAKKWNIEYVLVADRNSFYAYGWKRPALGNFEDAKYFRLNSGSAHQSRVASSITPRCGCWYSHIRWLWTFVMRIGSLP